jgi:hypothetical protein
MTRQPALVGQRDDRGRALAPLSADVERTSAPGTRRRALAALAALPAGATAAGPAVAAELAWRSPRRGGQRTDLVEAALAEAETLGLTGRGALTSYGRELVGGADEGRVATLLEDRLPPPVDHVLVQADLTVVAPGPLETDLAREMALVADVESAGAATVYRVTEATVRRALDFGRAASELHELFRSRSRTPVPQALTYLVDDVARQHGTLRVGAASAFVRCDDQAVLAQILADPLSGALGLRRLAPTVLASELDAGVLLERLRSMGFRPSAEAADGSVVIARAHARRAPARPAPEPLLAERPPPSDSLLAAAVRALRAGDRSVAGRPQAAAPGRLGRSVSAQTLADLRRALDDGATVWIGYVDHHGATSERVVDPVRLEGGWLAAYDHRSGEVRSFAVHRISGVAPVDAA